MGKWGIIRLFILYWLRSLVFKFIRGLVFGRCLFWVYEGRRVGFDREGGCLGFDYYLFGYKGLF